MSRIECYGFGAHHWWEKNRDHRVKIGATRWCDHCQKAMAQDAGWIVNWNCKDDSLYPIDVELTSPDSGHRLLGNECIKNFLSKDQYATYARRANEVQ